MYRQGVVSGREDFDDDDSDDDAPPPPPDGFSGVYGKEEAAGDDSSSDDDAPPPPPGFKGVYGGAAGAATASFPPASFPSPFVPPEAKKGSARAWAEQKLAQEKRAGSDSMSSEATSRVFGEFDDDDSDSDSGDEDAHYDRQKRLSITRNALAAQASRGAEDSGGEEESGTAPSVSPSHFDPSKVGLVALGFVNAMGAGIPAGSPMSHELRLQAQRAVLMNGGPAPSGCSSPHDAMATVRSHDMSVSGVSMPKPTLRQDDAADSKKKSRWGFLKQAHFSGSIKDPKAEETRARTNTEEVANVVSGSMKLGSIKSGKMGNAPGRPRTEEEVPPTPTPYTHPTPLSPQPKSRPGAEHPYSSGRSLPTWSRWPPRLTRQRRRAACRR